MSRENSKSLSHNHQKDAEAGHDCEDRAKGPSPPGFRPILLCGLNRTAMTLLLVALAVPIGLGVLESVVALVSLPVMFALMGGSIVLGVVIVARKSAT